MSRKTILIKILSILRQVLFCYQTLLIKKLKKKRTVRPAMSEMIVLIAQQEKVDPQLAVAVAICESDLNPDAYNQNRNNTIDRGLYQWNDFYHPEIFDSCAYDPECACRKFCQAVKTDHLVWWNASRPCWSR